MKWKRKNVLLSWNMDKTYDEEQGRRALAKKKRLCIGFEENADGSEAKKKERKQRFLQAKAKK